MAWCPTVQTCTNLTWLHTKYWILLNRARRLRPACSTPSWPSLFRRVRWVSVAMRDLGPTLHSCFVCHYSASGLSRANCSSHQCPSNLQITVLSGNTIIARWFWNVICSQGLVAQYRTTWGACLHTKSHTDVWKRMPLPMPLLWTSCATMWGGCIPCRKT